MNREPNQIHHGDTETRSLHGENLQESGKQNQTQNLNTKATEKYWRTRKDAISAIGEFFRILIATLREIFDENAYQRFLQQTGAAASGRSYRAFQRERETSVASRPRCC
jgi:hypothetical protein